MLMGSYSVVLICSAHLFCEWGGELFCSIHAQLDSILLSGPEGYRWKARPGGYRRRTDSSILVSSTDIGFKPGRTSFEGPAGKHLV